MNNQNSKDEKSSTIYFSPTGGNLPPIEEKDIVEGNGLGRVLAEGDQYTQIIVPLQKELLEYSSTIQTGEARVAIIQAINKLFIPLNDKKGNFLGKFARLMGIVDKREHIHQCIGTSEYNELQEDIADKAMKDFRDAKTDEMVNHPKHYNTDGPVITIRCKCGEVIKKTLECIDVIRDMPSWKGNTIKYLWRCGLKKEEGMSDIEKEIQDLEKAIWYINDRIKQLEKELL